MIQCENISKTYKISQFLKSKYIKALDDVTFSINKREVFSIIGLNGAGKSTLLSIILGITTPTSGRIKFLIDKYKEKIGYMPEIVNFPLNLTPINILKSMKNLFITITDEKIENVLNKVGLSDVKNNRLKTFSKGMLQRFNLAQAIVHDPEILIMDEPFSGLDPLGRKLFFEIFMDLNNKGTTILFSSHILTDVEKISDRILILHKGTVAKILEPKELNKSLENYFFEIIE